MLVLIWDCLASRHSSRVASKMAFQTIQEWMFLEFELRKRIFWSVYTLDKYLSIMFGRPRLLHDEDIDQQFPDEMNDEDLLEEDPARRTGSTDSMMIASVLHFRSVPTVFSGIYGI